MKSLWSQTCHAHAGHDKGQQPYRRRHAGYTHVSKQAKCNLWMQHIPHLPVVNKICLASRHTQPACSSRLHCKAACSAIKCGSKSFAAHLSCRQAHMAAGRNCGSHRLHHVGSFLTPDHQADNAAIHDCCSLAFSRSVCTQFVQLSRCHIDDDASNSRQDRPSTCQRLPHSSTWGCICRQLLPGCLMLGPELHHAA